MAKLDLNPHMRRLIQGLLAATIFSIIPACSGSSVDAGQQTIRTELGSFDQIWARIMGWSDPTTFEEAQADHERQHFLREEFLASCMARQGFAYYISAPGTRLANAPHIIAGTSDTYLMPGSREWAQEYGFGVSTHPVELRDTLSIISVPGWVSANQEMLESLSPLEAQAWTFAFEGVGFLNIIGVEGHSAQNQMLGCYGEYLEVAHAEMELTDQFIALADEVNQLRFQIAADPRVRQLDESWMQCMAERGYSGWSWNSPRALHNWHLDEWYLLHGGSHEVSHNRNWVESQDTSLTPSAISISSFRELEINLALADWDCRNLLQYDEIHQSIDFDIQNRFMVRHGPELEAWAQYVETRRAGLIPG